jgi:hypothetical protein
LYQTIKNPLYPANKRLRWYLITSVLFILTLFGLEYKLIDGSIFVALDTTDTTQTFQGYIEENRQKWKILLIVPFMGQLVIGVYSCYKAFKSFTVPGVGQEVRVRVIKRQMAFVIITVICNSPLTLSEVLRFILIHIFQNYNEDSQLIKNIDLAHDWGL